MKIYVIGIIISNLEIKKLRSGYLSYLTKMKIGKNIKVTLSYSKLG